MKKIAVVLAAPALLGITLSTPAAASPAKSTATLQVDILSDARVASSGMSVGTPLAFSGCGYAPGAGVGVYVVSATATTYYGASVGSDGCFTTADVEAFVPQEAGSFKASAYQFGHKRADATTTFTVTR